MIIPEGEGYFISRCEGKKKLIIPSPEASVSSLPYLYFHLTSNSSMR